MLKFITADADTLGKKRKQAAQACAECRQKKKRCGHQPSPRVGRTAERRSSGSGSSPVALTSAPLEADPQRISGSVAVERPFRRQDDLPPGGHADQNNDASDSTQVSDAIGSRFIGDLNPESILIAATSPDATRGRSPSNSIGIWLTEKLKEKAVSFDPNAPFEHHLGSLFYGSASVVPKVLAPILVQECLSLLPPSKHLRALSSFYFDKIHPIIPIVEQTNLQNLPFKSPVRILLQQGICLVASMNFCSMEHLRFSEEEPPQGYREFGRRLFAAMRISMEMRIVTDKIVLIQALGLMSHFADGPDGSDLSAELCSRAVHCVHSLGLHVSGRRSEQDDQYAITLLCCIWALDRINAATHGRPVLMHERDIGRDMQACFERQEPCFRLLLGVVSLLDSVIHTYRPAAQQSERESEFLSFEDLLATSGALHVSTPLLATIETLYQAVAILSCRPRAPITNMHSSPSHIRQSLSALQVTLTLEQGLPHHLVLLPFVAYAVSLSLSIAYREMRHTKVPMYRTRARAHLQRNCGILEELGEIFWTAGKIAEMGNLTLQEFDRVHSTVLSSHRRGTERNDRTPATNGADVRCPDHSPHFNPDIHSQVHHPSVRQRRSEAPSGVMSAEVLPEAETIPSAVHSGAGTTSMLLQDSNPSVFNDMPDLDVFGLFDANFDLDGVDAYLQGNLDLSFPNNLQ